MAQWIRHCWTNVRNWVQVPRNQVKKTNTVVCVPALWVCKREAETRAKSIFYVTRQKMLALPTGYIDIYLNHPHQYQFFPCSGLFLICVVFLFICCYAHGVQIKLQERKGIWNECGFHPDFNGQSITNAGRMHRKEGMREEVRLIKYGTAKW